MVTELQDWISTGRANQILNIGICDDTFRDKFKDSIPWMLTPGGKVRWNRQAVLELAQGRVDMASTG